MKKLLIGSSTIAALAMVPTIALAHPGSLDLRFDRRHHAPLDRA